MREFDLKGVGPQPLHGCRGIAQILHNTMAHGSHAGHAIADMSRRVSTGPYRSQMFSINDTWND